MPHDSFSNPDLYKPLHATPVKSEVKQQTVNSITQPKQGYAATQEINTPTPIPKWKEKTIKLLQKAGLLKKDYHPDYVQISPAHGRSATELAISHQALWQDDEGNFYGDRDHKGNLMLGARNIQIDDTGYGGLRVNGLKDGWVIDRIVAVSKYLRSHHYPTENIVEIRKLEEVVDSGQTIDIQTWKKDAADRFLAQNPKIDGNPVTRKEVEEYLSTDFYTLTRDLQVNERLRDFTYMQSGDDFDKSIIPIINWYRLASKYKPETFAPINIIRDPSTNEVTSAEIDDFMSRVIPTNMANNLSHLHNDGLRYGYAHAQNYSGVGSFYDADSICGPALNLGDEPNIFKDIQRDFTDTLGALHETYTSRALDQHKYQYDAVANFVVTYMNNTQGENNWNIDTAKSLIDPEHSKVDSSLLITFETETIIKAYLEKVSVPVE